MKTGKPNRQDGYSPDVDTHVASRLCLRIQSLSLSTGEVAARAGLRAADLAVFLSGSVRIPASALFALARALDVRVHFFFERGNAEAVA